MSSRLAVDFLTETVQVVAIFPCVKISGNLLRKRTTLSHSTAELHRNEEDNESLFSLDLRVRGERFLLHRNV